VDDVVNHPHHYTHSGKVECIEAIESSMSPQAFKGFLKGNCIKYLYRYENKNGSEDLKKCRWYLDRLTSLVEAEDIKKEKVKLQSAQCTGSFFEFYPEPAPAPAWVYTNSSVDG
jgi:CRISPR/Cas system-associated protein Cas5 (RAMP superfamily)